MPVPKLEENTGLLPEGEHRATLQEIAESFGHQNAVRQKLMDGLKRAADHLKAAGVDQIWVDGSFVTSKSEPNDIDGCWEFSKAVDVSKLDDCFVSMDRGVMKERYGLDFFPSFVVESGSRLPFPEFFQQNREGTGRKGIVVVKLEGGK